MASDLQALAKPFGSSLIKKKPGQGGGDYVEHGVVTQKLLSSIGPFHMENVEPVYGIVPDKVNDKGEVVRHGDPHGIVGCLLTCRFHIDGREVVVTEAGDVEHPEDKHTNGARMKDAVSDAVKRCAMRVGAGLQLWGESGYFLPKALENGAEVDQ